MNGILLIDKPKDFTSHDVIAKLRKLTGIKKIGHTGTLDPNATGLLVVCVGEATKLIPYLENSPKEYIAQMILGSEMDTDDLTGKTTNIGHKDVSIQELDSSIKKFIGEQEQVVPIYSAKKVNGKKLYEYARSGKEVELPKNRVNISEIELLNSKYFPDSVTIRVNCSKGTYIRSLIRDIGQELTTLAHMGDLRRSQTDTYNIEDSVKLEDLTPDNVSEYLIPIEKIELKYPEVLVSDQGIKFLRNGNQLFGRNLESDIDDLELDQIVSLKSNDNFVGLGRIQNNGQRKVVQPVKVLNVF